MAHLWQNGSGLNVDYFGVFFEEFFSEMSKSLGTKFEALLSNQQQFVLLERQKDFNSVKSRSPEGLSSNFTPAAVFKATKSRFRLRRSPSAHKIVASNNERLSDLGV